MQRIFYATDLLQTPVRHQTDVSKLLYSSGKPPYLPEKLLLRKTRRETRPDKIFRLLERMLTDNAIIQIATA